MKKFSFISLGALVALVAAAAPVSAQCGTTAICTTGQDLLWSSTNLSPSSSAAEALFLAALTGEGTEDFESFIVPDPAPVSLTFPGAGTASLTGTGLVDNEDDTDGNGREGFSGTQYYEVSTNSLNTNSFDILFTDDIVAFGFYGIDVGDFGAQLHMDFYDEFDAFMFTWTPIHGLGAPPLGSPGQAANEGNLNYFSLINDDPFRRVSFRSTGGGADVWGFDDMTIAVQEQVIDTIPEPASMTLLATGLAGLAAARRRKNAKK